MVPTGPKATHNLTANRKTEMRISDTVVDVGRQAAAINTNTPFFISFTMKLKCVDRMQMLVRVDRERERERVSVNS